MSKPERTTTPGTKVQPPPLPKHEAGRVSGARRALNYAAYDGMMQLGSDAFNAPLPPPKSERPRFAPPRKHIGWYMISAAAGFSVGAVALAIAFKPSLTPERPPVSLAQTAGYIGPWTIVSHDQKVQMREVLEPVPVPKPIAAAPTSAEPTAVAEVAPAPSVASPGAAATEETRAPAIAAAPPESSAVSDARAEEHDAHTSSSAHHHARNAAPVAQLSRAQVIATMHQVEPEVSACFHGTRGSVMADITIVGRTGRVTTAQINGLSGAVGSCIARAVRRASFPTFKGETLTIRYPFAH